MNELKEAISAVQNAIRRAECADASGALLQKADLTNILSLLKAQEPRILDYEELKKEAGKIAVWPEITMGDGHKELFAPCTPIFMIDKPETIGLKSTGNILFMDEHAYKTEGGFVCWSSRPTDEQREATPWE